MNSNGFCSGVIADLGLDSEVSERMCGTETGVDVIDASGKCIVPGLVDGHVHPVWAGKELINLFKTLSPIILITYLFSRQTALPQGLGGLLSFSQKGAFSLTCLQP